MSYIGNTPSAVPLSSADLVDGTVTADDLNSTLDLSSKTVTLPASSVTDHVTATDLSPLENDFAILALHQAINENKSAHNLANTFIEQFEDSTSIALTNCGRDSSDEYVSCSILGTADYISDSESTGNRTSAITVTQTGNFFWTGASYSLSDFVDGDTSTTRGYISNGGGSFVGATLQFDFGSGNAKIVQAIRHYNNNSLGIKAKVEATNDTTGSWTELLGSTAFTANGPSEDFVFSSNLTTYRYYRLVGTLDASQGGYLTEVEFKIATNTFNSTGSFTSTTITPQDSASKSSLGLVLLYKNNAGTNTLNTDIIAKVSADNGSNYSTCVLASKGTFSTGINIAIAPAISVTAGTQLKYKVEFANQASGSKEAQIHGVALQY